MGEGISQSHHRIDVNGLAVINQVNGLVCSDGTAYGVQERFTFCGVELRHFLLLGFYHFQTGHKRLSFCLSKLLIVQGVKYSNSAGNNG